VPIMCETDWIGLGKIKLLVTSNRKDVEANAVIIKKRKFIINYPTIVRNESLSLSTYERE
jgi:hypothetical protein